MVSAPGRRMQVAHAQKRWKLSLRRACALLDTPRSGVRHESKRALKDAPVIARMRELGARHGYRFIRILLEREGHKMGPDRAYRLWRHAGLQVPRKRSRNRVAASRPRPTPPKAQNAVWAIDFVSMHAPMVAKSSASRSSTPSDGS